MLPWQSSALLNYQRLGGYQKTSRQPSSNSWTMRLNPSSFEGSEMTIMEYPMPVLRRPNEPISKFNDDLRQTAKEMMSIMYQSKGVGLAAPQVNIGWQLFVYNPTGDPKEKNFERVVCNPVIKEYSDDTDVEEEGCLSSLSDGCSGCVCRACAIMVEYQNELGQRTTRRLKGFEARVFQHEYDHIQGILHFDRFSGEDKEKNQAVLDDLVEKYSNPDALLEPDPAQFKKLQPSPLTAGHMPPRSTRVVEAKEEETPKKKPKSPAKAGFGGGGFGGGGSKPKSKRKKK
jgi:peptide deformylase